MILADKIADLRKKNGWSQEELAEMLDVSRQSISKWESAQAMPDMNRVLKLSELFGVSTDYLLKDNMELQTAETPPVESSSARTVSMEEASAFLTFKNLASRRVSLGVMLCVLAPSLLMILPPLQAKGIIPISDNAAAGLVLIFILLLIACAVTLFLTAWLKGQPYQYLWKEEIDTAYGVDGMVKERREKYRGAYSVHLVAGIILCVVSALPIILSMVFFLENDVAIALSVGFSLIQVAMGLFLIVHCSIIWGGFKTLLQEGSFTPQRKAENKRHEPIGVIYWGSVTSLYLAVSLLGNVWDKSWIIWPVACVAYGVVLAIVRVLKKNP